MISTKKALLKAAIALSTLIGLAYAQTPVVDAASTWTARTVEQVKADFSKAGNSESYTIKYGDTLGVIAKAANVGVNDLVKINNIENANLIFPGTTLTFEKDGSGKVASVQVKDNKGTKKYKVSSSAAVKTTATSTSYRPRTAYVGSSSSAKEIIAQRESGGSYSARNGQYIGRYQLSAAYLNGDYSPANQERVADNYVASRYGSWDAALAFWNTHGWY